MSESHGRQQVAYSGLTDFVSQSCGTDSATRAHTLLPRAVCAAGKSQGVGSGSGPSLCRNFSYGTCVLGDECKYSHGSASMHEKESSPAGGRRKPLVHIILLYANDARVSAYAERVAQKFLSAGVDVFLNVSPALLALAAAALQAVAACHPRLRRAVALCAHAAVVRTLTRKRARFSFPRFFAVLQTDLAELGLGDPSAGVGQQIKVEHLSTVLKDWHGDFAIGERSASNDTMGCPRAPL